MKVIKIGMYDSIKNRLYCPFCGKIQEADDFQTKSFKCSLTKLDILKIRGVDYEIHHICINCNNWISLNIGSYMGNSGGIHTTEEGKKQLIERKKELKKLGLKE